MEDYGFDVERAKAWYLEAVKGYLVHNYSLMGFEAEKLIEAGNLKDTLDKYPLEQLHYTIQSTADDIYEKHKEEVTPQYMS